MGDITGLASKIVGGAGILIAIYLIWTNPKTTGSLLDKGSSAANSFAKTLQGR